MPSQRFLSRRVTAVLASISTLALLAAAAISAPVSAASTVTLTASADALVRSNASTTNFGSSTQIRVDGTPTVHSYLRFDLGNVSGTVTHAVLNIHANSASGIGYSAYRTSDGWSEKTIDYANAPATGAFLGNSATFPADADTKVDVTAAAKAGGSVDIELVARNSTAINLASRESSNPPRLVLTVSNGGATNTPGATRTPAPTAGATRTPSPTAGATATPTSRPTATPTTAPTPTATSTAVVPPPSGDVLLAAGDICITSSIANAKATAALINARPNAVVQTIGDNSNESGTAAQYSNCYNVAWGAFKSRTHAAPGNHDYMTSGAGPYYAYFGAAAGAAGKGYYSYNLGNNWHVVVLNALCSEVGGCNGGSPQEVFLKNDLAANPGKHIIAVWHIPTFSSGGAHGNNGSYTAFWNDLLAAHADIILDGHDHDYERFALQNAAGQADPNGIREFVVGTGGAGQRAMGTIRANSQVRSTGTFGVLQLTLGAHSYSWQFIPVAGKTFTDSGTQATHS